MNKMYEMSPIEQILADSLTVHSALNTVSHALGSIAYLDNDEQKIRETVYDIAGGLECVQDFHDKITDAMDKLALSERQATKDEKANPEEAGGLDCERIEKAALDNERACATIGCLISALHDHGGDNTENKVGDAFCWQLRASLETVYDILKETSVIFYEASELIEREGAGRNAEDNGQDSV